MRIRTDRGYVARAASRIKNVPYKVKAIKAKQPEIELEDDLVIDDDDLDLIDHGEK